MESRKLDEIISNLEDVTKSVEEAKEMRRTDTETLGEAESLGEAEHTLEEATDSLEEMEEEEQEGEGGVPR